MKLPFFVLSADLTSRQPCEKFGALHRSSCACIRSVAHTRPTTPTHRLLFSVMFRRSVSFADRQKDEADASVDVTTDASDADDSDYMYDSDESGGSGRQRQVKKLLKEVHARESRLNLREKQQNDAREGELDKREGRLDQRDKVLIPKQGRLNMNMCMVLSNLALIVVTLWYRTEQCRCTVG